METVPRRRPVFALIGVAVALFALGFVPGLEGATAALWLAGLASLVVAFVVAIRAADASARHPVLTVIAFVIAVVAGIAVVHATSGDAANAAVPSDSDRSVSTVTSGA